MLSVPRQCGKNCIPNSIVAVLIELQVVWHAKKVNLELIRKYSRFYSFTRYSNLLIKEAMTEANVLFEYISTTGSLITNLTANNVCLAIAVESATHHAYPIKKNFSPENEYLTINQFGTFYAEAIYTPLKERFDVGFYAIRPGATKFPSKELNSKSEELIKSLDE